VCGVSANDRSREGRGYPFDCAARPPVAILGSETFDVGDVDGAALRFGPSAATIAHFDVHPQDVNFDGVMDLVAHFRTRETGIACGDESAVLTGATLDGQSFEAEDSVQTVGCRAARRGGLERPSWTQPQRR
jgi:hypothetical protein